MAEEQQLQLPGTASPLCLFVSCALWPRNAALEQRIALHFLCHSQGQLVGWAREGEEYGGGKVCVTHAHQKFLVSIFQRSVASASAPASASASAVVLLGFFMPLYGLLPVGVHGVAIIIRANTSSSSLITIMAPLATCHTQPVLYMLYMYVYETT